MYYRVKDNFLIRGWKLLPFALYDMKTHSTCFLDKETFSIIQLCDGEHFVNINELSLDQQGRLNELIKENIVQECKRSLKLNDNQKYKKFPSRYMSFAQWSITGKCNYKCRHCFMSAPEAKFGELSLSEIKKIISELAECGVYNVSLTGGEPLVRSDFLEILDALANANINVSAIYSNGKLVNSELLDAFELRNMKPVVHMSYDGKGWHDWIRGVYGAEKSVTDAYKLCSERGFLTTAEMCIHKGNRDVFIDTMNELAELNCRSLKVNPAAMLGNWTKSSVEYTLSTKEVYDTYLEYIKQFFESGMKISLMLDGFFYCEKGSQNYSIPYIKYDSKVNYSKITLCGHARNSLYIDPEGIALPCMVLANTELKKKFPNMLDKKLCEILTDSYYLKIIDTRLQEYFDCNQECYICDYKNLCAGGCRGMAVIDNNSDYFTKDLAACFFFKNNYHEKIKMLVDSLLTNLDSLDSKKVRC